MESFLGRTLPCGTPTGNSGACRAEFWAALPAFQVPAVIAVGPPFLHGGSTLAGTVAAFGLWSTGVRIPLICSGRRLPGHNRVLALGCRY
jgi:hypothetical protein